VLAADPSYEPAIRLMRSLQSEPPPR